MAFEDTEMEMEEEEPQSPPPEESNNRTFIIVAAILGGIMLLALLCTAAYAFVILPRTRSQKEAQVATLNAQNTALAKAATQTSEVLKWTPTPKPTNTPTKPAATATPVVVVQATNTPTENPEIRASTQTAEALYTQVAEAQLTTIPTSTALPTSGFADEVGVPGLLALAAVLVIVIFLVRRLRTAS